MKSFQYREESILLANYMEYAPGYQNSESSLEKFFYSEFYFTKIMLSLENLREEIKPVVRKSSEFNHRDKSFLRESFELFGLSKLRPTGRNNDFSNEYCCVSFAL